jgi:ribosomal protein S10
MTKQRIPLEGFNDAKLADLSEPITVTVHKLMNGRPCPITLPVKPNEDIPGKGWTADEVRQLDQFLVEHLSGGGEYHNTATGENGTQLRWRAYFPVDRYPEKGVVTSQPPSNGGGNGHVTQLGSPGVQAVSTPNHQPPPGWMHAAAASMPQVQQHQQYPQMSQIYPQQLSHYQPAQAPMPFDGRLQEEREARLQLEAKIERERLESAYKEQLATITQELRRVQEQMQIRPSGETPEAAALKAELAEMRKERENDKIMMLIREVQQSTQQQIAQLTQMITQMSQRPTGPDPMIMMLIESQKTQAAAQLESARLQADAQKESARLQTEAQKESARNAIGPREMVDIAAKFNSGHDQIANAYTRLIEVSQHTFENMLNAQGPQTHPALEMVGQGMQGVMGIAQRYIEAKENSVLHQSQAVAAQAQANAQAQIAVAAAASQSGQLAAPAAQAVPVAVGADEEEEEEDDDEVEAMEQDLFGEALSSVQRLRKGVELSQITPEQGAAAILQGIDHFAKKGEPIKAFALWQQNELAKLVDILIPDAMPSFKDQMAGHLFEARKKFK